MQAMEILRKETSQKKKILYLITKSNFGGAQKYVFDLATSDVLQSNYNLSVALGGNGELYERLDQLDISTISIQSLSNSLNPFKLLRQIYEIRKVLKRESPNILHMNSNMAALAGVFAVLSINFFKTKTNTIKIVFTAHGWPFNENRNIFEKLLLKTLICFIILESDETICVSHTTKSQLPIFIQKKCIVIYNGIDEIQKDKNTAVNKLIDRESHKPNTLHLVSVGELHHVKGHDMVISALEKLKTQPQNTNIHYHILGEGSYRNQLESLIKKLDLEDGVTLHGYVKNAREYIEQFDIFIMPSRSEALAFALLEGYASGLPIIATDVGGMPEIVKQYEHNKNYLGTLVKPDTDSIQKALENMVENRGNLKSEQIAKEIPVTPIVFTKNYMLEKTLDVYKYL